MSRFNYYPIILTHDLGIFENIAALILKYPEGRPGDFAKIVETDTIWIWNAGTLEWADSGEEEIAEQAIEARDKAKKWADEDEDIEVESGKFSAKHHSKKSEHNVELTEENKVASQAAQLASEIAAASSGAPGSESDAIQLLRLHDPNLVFSGFVNTSTSTPSHIANKAYINTTPGTVFGIANVPKGAIIKDNGNSFVVESLFFSEYFFKNYRKLLQFPYVNSLSDENSMFLPNNSWVIVPSFDSGTSIINGVLTYTSAAANKGWKLLGVLTSGVTQKIRIRAKSSVNGTKIFIGSAFETPPSARNVEVTLTTSYAYYDVDIIPNSTDLYLTFIKGTQTTATIEFSEVYKLSLDTYISGMNTNTSNVQLMSESDAIAILKLHNPDLVWSGFVNTGTAKPASVLNNAYIATASGAMWDIVGGVTKGQVIKGTGSTFVAENFSNSITLEQGRKLFGIKFSPIYKGTGITDFAGVAGTAVGMSFIGDNSIVSGFGVHFDTLGSNVNTQDQLYFEIREITLSGTTILTNIIKRELKLSPTAALGYNEYILNGLTEITSPIVFETGKIYLVAFRNRYHPGVNLPENQIKTKYADALGATSDWGYITDFQYAYRSTTVDNVWENLSSPYSRVSVNLLTGAYSYYDSNDFILKTEINDFMPVKGLNFFESQFLMSLSKYEKPLTKIGVVGDSLMANSIGGNIPVEYDEGNTMRPLRLVSNQIARRIYDLVSWNKATHRRLDHADWTKSGTWTTITTGLFEGAQDTYHKSVVSGSYVEISVPSGKENFAFICRRDANFGILNITLNGGSIAAYGNATVDLDRTKTGGASDLGNAFHTEIYTGLPAGVNVIRIAKEANTEEVQVFGGFYWTGKTLIVHNVAHGGHNLDDLLTQHLQAEVVENDFDAILFQLPLMNECGHGTGVIPAQTKLETILATILTGKDVCFMGCQPFGTDPTDGTPNYYANYPSPSMEDYNTGLKSILWRNNMPFVDVFTAFKRKIENRGGSLATGEGGLWYTHDGQHQSEAGMIEYWNLIKFLFLNKPISY